MKGKFITFEGCEGVGKSTQLQLLKQYLQEQNIDCLFLREPGGTKISENIRNLILSLDSVGMSSRCEALLYSAARAQLIDEVIYPALQEGKLVICDRFIDSSFAYQGYARGLGFDLIGQLNNISCKDIIPDLTIFFDLSPEKGFIRKGGADSKDRLEQEKNDFHVKVYEGYKQASVAFADRIKTIDADSDVTTIFQQVINALQDKKILGNN